MTAGVRGTKRHEKSYLQVTKREGESGEGEGRVINLPKEEEEA